MWVDGNADGCFFVLKYYENHFHQTFYGLFLQVRIIPQPCGQSAFVCSLRFMEQKHISSCSDNNLI